MTVVFTPQQTCFVETSDIRVSTAQIHKRDIKARLTPEPVASACPQGESQHFPEVFPEGWRPEKTVDQMDWRCEEVADEPRCNPSTKENNVSPCPKHTRSFHLTVDRDTAERT